MYMKGDEGNDFLILRRSKSEDLGVEHEWKI